MSYNFEYKGRDVRVKGDKRVEVTVAGDPTATAIYQTPVAAKLAIDAEVPDVVDEAPVLTALDPGTAEMQSGDITVTITGTGFTETSVLVWNDADDVADYVSPTELTTTVKTDLSTVAVDCKVEVRNGDQLSNSLTFSITEPEVKSSRKKR
jgi:hypothetical protein